MTDLLLFRYSSPASTLSLTISAHEQYPPEVSLDCPFPYRSFVPEEITETMRDGRFAVNSPAADQISTTSGDFN